MTWLDFLMGMVVPSLFQELFDKIKNSAYEHMGHAFSDVKTKLETLKENYVKAQSVLDEVDEWKLVTSYHHRDWNGDAIRACYDMEDIALDVMVELRKSGYALSYLENWIQSRNIDELQGKLDQVLSGATNFIDTSRRSTQQTVITVTRPRKSPDTFLRIREKDQIVKMLLCSTSTKSIAGASTSTSRGSVASPSRGIIISIEGMFGLGKSVLAEAVMTDKRIQDYFDHRFWIPVSGDFNLETARKSMVIQPQNLEQVQQQDLKDNSECLCNRRLLVVLDDLCNFTNYQDWLNFLDLLNSVCCILITTRNPKITKTVSSQRDIPVVPYYLKLITSTAIKVASHMPSKRKRGNYEENVLKVAAKFSNGLPLVADVLSVHFSLEPKYSSVEELSEEIWSMPEFEKHIFPAFRLDYSNLPKAVKNCFRYLSLFPNNFKFNKQDLVQLWMAEGFIVPKVAGPISDRSLEKTANEYFDELLSRSILRTCPPYDEEIHVYIMHEFLHRYAQYVCTNVYLRLDKEFVDAHSNPNESKPQTTDISIGAWYSKARHISFLSQTIVPSILEGLEKCKALRTLVSPQEWTCVDPLSYRLFLELQSLRVLNLQGTDISKLPESIGKLKHLKLLDVSSTVIQDLPASTTSLHELRVLKLNDCRELLRLPTNIRNLTNLQHLEIDGTRLSSMPPKIGKLKNLQTLPIFVVGDDDGYFITELKDMKHLEGSIYLKGIENVTTSAEARQAKLNKKPQLRKLELEWCSSSIDQEIAEEVLNGLKPHENLEELRVANYDGVRFPSWLSSPERGLKSIHLQGCHRCSSLPSLGQLQRLTHLHIQGMHDIKHVDHQFSSGLDVAGFPSLVSLKFEGINNLEKWDGLQATQMSHLCELNITDCPKLISLPPLNQLTSLKRLEIWGCPLLKSLSEEILPSSLESLMIEGNDPSSSWMNHSQGIENI